MSSIADAWAREELADLGRRGLLRTLEPLASPQGAVVRIGGQSLVRGSAEKLSGSAAARSAAPRPALRPNTKPSSRLFEASRFAPCSPLEVTSPAAHSSGTLVRPSASTVAPPIM